ncbi:MAG: hypothetical protein WBD09_09060 [Halobacteriota archaeon]
MVDKENLDCAKCPNMPSMNLYRKDEIEEYAGGELHILSITLDENWGIYHNIGGLYGFFEVILIDMHENLSNISLLHMMMWQCARDLKASIFLAFCGHYRQAMMVMRGALEIFIYGAYFQLKTNSAKSKEEKEELEKLCEDWRKGTRDKKSFSAVTKELKSEGKLSAETKKITIAIYYGVLSKHIHTFIGDDVERVFNNEDGRMPIRKSSTFYDNSYLNKCSETLIELFSLISEVLQRFSPKLTTKGEDGLRRLKSLLKILKDDKSRAVAFTSCSKITI